jgi:lipopolysaccharide biosynthesis regulator YciM
VGALQAQGRPLGRSPPRRESPHYILGLNFLVASQIDPAIDELTKAAELAGDPLEIR